MSQTITADTLDPTELRPLEGNPRIGDVPAIKESLRRSGQFRSLVVNKGGQTGRPLEVLAGNHTLAALLELRDEEPDDPRWQKVSVDVVDVDDEGAKIIVAADNRIGALGTFDDVKLAELLAGLDDLDGTGYTGDDLDDLMALIEEDVPDPEGEPAGAVSGGDTAGTEDGGGLDDGMTRSHPLEDTAEGYAARPTRMVIFQYSLDLYVWVQQKLEAYAEGEGLFSNADALVRLLEENSGETAPAEPEDDE